MSNIFVSLWPVACQAPLSMGFLRQQYWSGLPFPSPGDLPDPGIKPESLALPMDSLPLNHQGSLHMYTHTHTHTHYICIYIMCLCMCFILLINFRYFLCISAAFLILIKIKIKGKIWRKSFWFPAVQLLRT